MLTWRRSTASAPQSLDRPFKAPREWKTFMAVLRKAHKSNFTVIDNQVFKSNLSLKARGLLSTMLSLPDDWHFTERGLSSILPKDGRDSVRSAVKELEEEGFLSREKICDEQGKVTEWLWTFYDYPQSSKSENPRLENPTLDNPTLENPRLDAPTQLNTKEVNTNGESKKGVSTNGYAYAPDTPEAKAAPEKKGTYGCYGNVKLTDTDLSKLKDEFPDDWQERIDLLSTYMDSTGKSYKNHLATIRNWARRDSERQKPSRKSDSRASEQDGQGKRIADMTIEEIMEKHSVDYMTAQEMAFDMC